MKTLSSGRLHEKFYQELKHIRENRKTSLKQYKEAQEFHFHLITNRVNSRFR